MTQRQTGIRWITPEDFARAGGVASRAIGVDEPIEVYGDPKLHAAWWREHMPGVDRPIHPREKVDLNAPGAWRGVVLANPPLPEPPTRPGSR